ncbi:hypothetical protein [Photobacterium profundum]|nr:hypothetical protein [Photobacterium profundum]
MAEIKTEGFEFFGVEEREFRMMVIERIETMMVHSKLSKNTLAQKANLGRSIFSVLPKLLISAFYKYFQ